MRRVQQATQRPFRCAVIPFLGNSNASGFIDTGMFLQDEKVYISFEGAVEIAKEIRWVGPSERRELQAQNAALQARVDQLEQEIREADKLIEASKYSLEKFGSKVQSKPGRKKKEATV